MDLGLVLYNLHPGWHKGWATKEECMDQVRMLSAWVYCDNCSSMLLSRGALRVVHWTLHLESRGALKPSLAGPCQLQLFSQYPRSAGCRRYQQGAQGDDGREGAAGEHVWSGVGPRLGVRGAQVR